MPKTHKMYQAELDRCKLEVAKCLAIAESKGFTNLPPVEVECNLFGKAAGQYKKQYGIYQLRFNPILMRENLDTFVARTIPHEVGHYLQAVKDGRCLGHSEAWHKIMMFVFGKTMSRCHNYDTSSCVSKTTYTYVCECRERQYESHRHRKIQRGQMTCTCKLCNGKVTLKEDWS